MQQLLTSGEAAKILGITPDGIRAIERRGVLSAQKTPSGRRFFLQTEVEALAAERAANQKRRRPTKGNEK